MSWVVNSAGITHVVDDAEVTRLLAAGMRLATAEEIAAWQAAYVPVAEPAPVEAEEGE